MMRIALVARDDAGPSGPAALARPRDLLAC